MLLEKGADPNICSKQGVSPLHAALENRNLGIADDNAFAEDLLIEAGVAVVPGSGFGAPNHMRLSFACSLQTLQDALQRMGKALSVAQAKRA